MVDADLKAVRDWLDLALVGYPDPLVPLPPIAKVDIHAVGPTEIQPVTEDGVWTGAQTQYRYFEVTLTFGQHEKTETVRGAAWHLRLAARADPTFGGRVQDGYIPLDETDPEDLARVEPRLGEDGWVVQIPVSLQEDFSGS
jgi:hypothetical protein